MIAASNGREALELAASQAPQLIVLDIMMPEMDGLTALKHLKREEGTKAIPVIVITANAHEVTRQESAASGAALVLTKPFSPAQLLKEVQRLVPA